MSYIRGKIGKVIHQSGTYHVALFDVDEFSGLNVPRNTVVAGHLFGVGSAHGAVLELQGDWHTHKKHGRQFKISSWSPWGKTTVSVRHFLGGCVDVFRDINLLVKVTDVFGTDTYDALDSKEVLNIAESEGETTAIGEAIARWTLVQGIAKLAVFLQEFELGATMIAAVYARFGLDSVELITANPYRLVEIDGFSFQRADRIAAARGISGGDPRRIAAGVLWVIRDQVKQQGHLFVRRGDFLSLMGDLSQDVEPFESEDLGAAISKALEELGASGAVRIDPGVGVYVPDMYLFERNSAELLSNFLEPVDLVLDLDRFIADYELASSISLSDMQRQAVTKLMENRVLVVTGAPGTGKTTVIRTFVHLFRSLGLTYALMAPTGIAAKRLSHVTETAASTIHRALRFDGFQWGVNETNRLMTQAVIVDELSMVDQELFYRLLSALDPTTMLVLVGDDAQLPSVGPGNVLRELIACEAVPTIRLEHVFRQAETSDIVLAAHRIRKGSSPLGLPPKDGTEFQFVRVPTEEKIAELIVQMAVKLKARDANFQVLAPKYEGVVGVDALNAQLRDALNPDVGQQSVDVLSFHARLGDRLMVIKNNYKLNVYNGDIGKLVRIGRDSLRLRVHGIGKSPDIEVEIPRDEAAAMLKLAYAVTVHKSQGEEFETVIMPLVRSQGRMLQRNLFYTAITRARSKVWVLGDPDAVDKAVQNDRVVQRNTVLRRVIAPNPTSSV